VLSCLDLERPGRWRALLLLAIALFASAPTLLLLRHGLRGELFGALAWGSALEASLAIAAGTAGAAFALGWPLGTAAALYRFPARGLLIATTSLPLLMPSLLLALGWSALSLGTGLPPPGCLGGNAGCLVLFAAPGVALVMVAALAAARAIPENQREAARLFGGERELFWKALRTALAPAGLAALLAGILTLSDPAPGQIFSLRTAAGAVLESFAARNDLALASRQCAALALTALALSLPLLAASLRGLALATLTRVPRAASLHSVGLAPACTTLAFLAVNALWILPAAGLALPLGREPLDSLAPAFGAAFARASDTALDSLGYTLGASALAAGLALVLAAAAGRSRALQGAVLALAVVLLAIPAAAPALGLASLAAAAPAWTDPVLRGPFAVWIALALHFLPVASLLMLRAWSSTAPAWFEAAALHGVSLATFAGRVLRPALAPGLWLAASLVALLAASEVVTVLLLHPPGRPSFALSVFTVMANAPEKHVAALCVVYLMVLGALLAAIAGCARARRPS
jgi:ABC-type Fe3+ transport system permease subunit